MLVPSGIHAKLSHPSKCRIPPQSPLFSRFHLKNHPLDSTKTQKREPSTLGRVPPGMWLEFARRNLR